MPAITFKKLLLAQEAGFHTKNIISKTLGVLVLHSSERRGLCSKEATVDKIIWTTVDESEDLPPRNYTSLNRKLKHDGPGFMPCFGKSLGRDIAT